MLVADEGIPFTDFAYVARELAAGQGVSLSRISAMSIDDVSAPAAKVLSSTEAAGVRQGVYRVYYNCKKQGPSTVVISLAMGTTVVSYSLRKNCGGGPLQGFRIVDAKSAPVIDQGAVASAYRAEFMGVRVHSSEPEVKFYVQLPKDRPAGNFFWKVRAW